jgi:multiple sugar transport system substrate-binding protein
MNAISKIALAALAAVALTPFTARAEKVNLTYLTHWSPESVAMLEKAATAYGKDHPDVSISVRAVPFGDLLTTLRASGGGAGGATMASIYNAWLPDLAKDKLIGPVPDAMGAEVNADWPAGIVGAASAGGALYGFPNEIDVYALNYNKKMFEAAGIKAPPTTWAEFLADAQALADKSKGQQGFGLINSWTAGVIHPFASLLASDGGHLVADGKSQFDSPAAKETFALYEKLVKDGLSDPTMGTSDANTTGPFLDNFVSGKTGMIIMANWWESALKSAWAPNSETSRQPLFPSDRMATSHTRSPIRG